MITFKDNELKALLAEVSADLEKAMAAEESELRKAAPGDEDESAGGPTAPAPDASAPEGSATSADASPAPAEGAPIDGSPEASSPAPEGSGDPAADAAPDPEALKAEYLKLGPDGIRVHLEAAKAAAMELLGGAGDAAPAPAPAPGPVAPSPSPAPAPAPGMMKEERLMSVQPKGKVTNGADRLDAVAVTKSEDMESLKAQVELLSKAVHEIVGKPMRKAVTEIPYNGKPETSIVQDAKPLSKTEVTAKLKSVTARRDLAKNDRERINQYYDGKISVEGISDLLK